MTMRERIIEEIPHLRRFARGLAREASRADDLVQDCIERALSREHLFDPSRSLRAWLFTILRNIFISQGRDLRLRATLSDALGGDDVDAAFPPGQETSVQARQVLQIVQTLSGEQRETLLLVAVEGLSYRETANVLGVPIGTVMSRLARAREQLRVKMEAVADMAEGRGRIRRIK